jgi:cytochrome b pre-mRNA-processing protein 3
MSLLKRLFGSPEPDPKSKLLPLYAQIVAKAREPHWYVAGHVPDSIDGRFDMVSAVLTITLLRLEASPEHAQDSAYLTEVFVDDMDGQLRQSGISDVIIGKNIGKMMSAVGGRLGAFRDALAQPEMLGDAVIRNIYRTPDVDTAALDHVCKALLGLHRRLAEQSPDVIVAGTATW